MDRYNKDFYMPFGKYQGKHIDDIPRHYLEWILSDVDMDQWEGLEDAIEEQLAMRDRSGIKN